MIHEAIIVRAVVDCAAPGGAGSKKEDQKSNAPSDRPRIQKLFLLKYADPNHVASLLAVFNASIRPDSDMHALAVETIPGPTMGAIEEAIQRLDVPSAAAKNIEMTAYLLIGSETAGTEPSAMPKELDAVVAQLKNAFAFKSYRLMDTLALRTRVGQMASTSSSGRGMKIGDDSLHEHGFQDSPGRHCGVMKTTIRIDGLNRPAIFPCKPARPGSLATTTWAFRRMWTSSRDRRW